MSPRKNSPRTGTLYWLPVLLDEERLDPADTLLLIALADHVNGDDECHVGLDRLAPRARCAYSTAKRRMASLAEQGVVERYRRRREDGNLSVYNYRLRREWFGEEPLTMAQSEPLPGPAQVVPDQGSPGEALTRARPDEPAEPPRGEPPRGEPSTQPTSEALELLPPSQSAVDDSLGFDAFWEVYPPRNGKKLNKRLAVGIWNRLSLQDRRTAWRGACHYADAVAAGVTIAKDPDRFLRHRGWEDWQEPATPTARGGPRASVVERSFAAIAHGPKHGIR